MHAAFTAGKRRDTGAVVERVRLVIHVAAQQRQLHPPEFDADVRADGVISRFKVRVRQRHRCQVNVARVRQKILARQPQVARCAIVLDVLCRDTDLECVVRLSEQRHSQAGMIFLRKKALVRRVADVAVAVGGGHGQPDRETFGRQVHVPCNAGGVEAAARGFDRGTELVFRQPRDDVDRAARGVAAVQRPLRALENFDALYVEQPRKRCSRGAEVHAVHMRRNGQRTAARIGNAAQCDAGAEHAAIGHHEAGYVVLQFVQAGRRRQVEKLVPDDLHAQRHVEQVFRHLAGRDCNDVDDVLGFVAIRGTNADNRQPCDKQNDEKGAVPVRQIQRLE